MFPKGVFLEPPRLTSGEVINLDNSFLYSKSGSNDKIKETSWVFSALSNSLSVRARFPVAFNKARTKLRLLSMAENVIGSLN